MYVARVICSDPECAREAVAEATDVMELAALLCECGCVADVRGLPDWVDEDVPDVLAFPARRPGDGLDLAA